MSESEHPVPPWSASGRGGGNHVPYPLRFFIEDPTGDVYRAEAQSDMLVRDVANDFFEERGWPARDQAGRAQRAVVERLDPDNPERTVRLRGDQTLHDAGVRNEDTLRVLPESVAGLFNPHERLRALVVDHREVQLLEADDPEHIEVKPNAEHAPTQYIITFRVPGIMRLDRVPQRANEHRVEITLPPSYPVEAPRVRWLTPIFHPNVANSGAVCLGVLMHRYMPGLGLAYIVRMLRDIAQYRNYDMFSPYNPEAAEWAKTEEGQQQIADIGGAPAETVGEALTDLMRRHERRQLGRVTRFEKHDRFNQDEEQ